MANIAHILAEIPAYETAAICVDLGGVAHNYKLLQERAQKAKQFHTQIGAAVKANGYGLGIKPIAQTLMKQGCKHFFVATPKEGAELRSIMIESQMPDIEIFILDGLLAGSIEYYIQHQLSPVLGSFKEIENWCNHPKPPQLKAAIHVDTGINRLGLTHQEAIYLSQNHPEWLSTDQISLLISHFSSADNPTFPSNNEQIQRFNEIRNLVGFNALPASLSNSGGHFLDQNCFYEITRPGIALYGGHSSLHQSQDIKSVVHVYARLIGKRQPEQGSKIGYGGSYSVKKNQVIGTIGVGYADGISRHLSQSDHQSGGFACFNGHLLPYLGRVSMDMITLDITKVKDQIDLGDFVEIIGNNVSAKTLADIAGTIDYELFTQLSKRAKWVYFG